MQKPTQKGARVFMVLQPYCVLMEDTMLTLQSDHSQRYKSSEDGGLWRTIARLSWVETSDIFRTHIKAFYKSATFRDTLKFFCSSELKKVFNLNEALWGPQDPIAREGLQAYSYKVRLYKGVSEYKDEELQLSLGSWNLEMCILL